MATTKKYQAGGVASKTVKAPMVDPKGAFTKVQKRTLGSMKKGGSVAKAQKGKTLSPTYKNLRMGVNNENYDSDLGYGFSTKPTALDSSIYRKGFKRGVEGEKEYPFERNVEKMGRWEGQNAAKAAKKGKTGIKVVKKPSVSSVKKVVTTKAKCGTKMSKKK